MRDAIKSKKLKAKIIGRGIESETGGISTETGNKESRQNRLDSPSYSKPENPKTKAEKKRQLEEMKTVKTDISAFAGETNIKEIRRIGKNEWIKLKNIPVTTKDGRTISFPNTGFDEIKQHSADARVMQIIPSLPELISNSLHLWSEPAEKPNHPNITEFHHYGVKAALNNKDFIVRLTIREDTGSNNIHYDHHLTDVEILQEPLTKPDRTANPGESQTALAKDKLYQWWNNEANNSGTFKKSKNQSALYKRLETLDENEDSVEDLLKSAEIRLTEDGMMLTNPEAHEYAKDLKARHSVQIELPYPMPEEVKKAA